MRFHVATSVAPLFLAGLVAFIGCSSKPPAKPHSASTLKSQAPDPSPEASQATTAPPRDLLAEQAAAYAMKMEQVLAKRQAEAEKVAAAKPATQPAAAQTADSAEIEQPDEVEVPAAGGAPVPHAAKPKHDVADDPNSDAPPTRATVSNDELLRRLAARAKEYPRDLAVHLDYQLLQLLRDEKVPGMPDIASLPAEDHELLAALLDAISNFRGAVQRDNNMLQSQKVRPLIELAARLRAQAELTIPTLALCKKVRLFGVYDPIEPEFAAGRPQEVIVYCEVENFASQLNEQQVWETRLSEDVVLYTETGLPVWQAKQHAVTDLSRNRRRDFFVVQKIVLPGNLTIGRYLLKVSVVDQNANRIAESTLPVKIVARANNNGTNGIAGINGNAQPGTAPATAPRGPLDAATTFLDAFNK